MLRRLAASAGRESTLVFAIGFWLALIQISIAASQIVLTGVFLLWLYQIATGKRELKRLPIDLPLVVFVLLSLLSAFFSFDPLSSLVDIKKLALFAVPYLIVSAVSRASTIETLILVLIGVADLASLVSLWQYFFGELGDINHRLHGFMSHYMTFSGLLMGVGVLALAELLFRGKRRIFLAASLALILTVLLLSLTRSAWLGVFVASFLLIFLRDRRLLVALPVIFVALMVSIPPEVELRLRSFVRPDVSGRDRYYMLETAMRMAANHPLLGVGPDMVSYVYPIYVIEGAPQQTNVHLHNNLAQIAAERGLPCLGAWLWMMASILVWSIRAYRHTSGNRDRQALAAGALGVLISGLAAGFFEYNFGDSEFLMLLLFAITIPFILERETNQTPSLGEN
jgi:O-antigen ligase